MTLFPTRGFRRTRERSSGLLFALGVDDLSTTLPTGHTLTLTRTSARTVYDSTGRVQTIAHSQVPWGAVENTTDSVWEPVLEVCRGTTNLCLQSEDFSTTWSAVGTPTRTAAAKRCGDLSLDLIGDDNAAALEGYTQTIAFVATNTKAISLFVAPGTSTSSVIRLRDSTAGANRLLATITWSGTTPVVTMTTGTAVSNIACANGVYRLTFNSTTVTAANTNVLGVYPATTSALLTTSTGTLYAGGVQAEEASWSLPYIKTTTTSVTTQADQPTATIAWAPQDCTVYMRFQRPPIPSDSAGWIYTYQLGSINQASIFAGIHTTGLWAQVDDGTTAVSTAVTPLSAGSMVEVAIQYTDMTTAAKVRVDVGSGFGSYSAATGGLTAWSDSTLRIGHFVDGGGANYMMDSGIRKFLIAAGARTLAEMRGMLV